MKNIYKLIIILIFIVSTYSCKDQFIEPDLILAVDEENFFSSDNQVFQGLVAAYDPLQWTFLDGQWTSGIMLGAIRSDNATAGGDNTNADQLGWQQIDDYLEDEFLVQAETFWKKYYSGIRRCNLLIANGDLGTTATNQYVAEAKFLRAFYHFELFRTYGPIPVITQIITPSEYGQSRNTMTEVFEQITQDLREAIPLMALSHPSALTGRATRGSAEALLGKAFLYWGDMTDNTLLFDSAALYLENVITSGQYELVDDYNDLFVYGAANTTESVFEIQHSNLVPGDFTTPGEFLGGNAIIQLCGIRGLCSTHPDYKAGWGFMLPSSSLFDAFLPGDTFRRDATIITQEELSADGCPVDLTVQNQTDFQGYWQQKYANYKNYIVPNGGEVNLLKDANQTYLRYADVLLMAAEALISGTSSNTAKAIEYIDQVRERGAGPGDNTGTFTITTALMTSEGWSLLEVIQYERRIEFALEGDRWFDLVRSGRLESSLWDSDDLRSGNVNENSRYLPIPQREVIATNNELTVYPDAALFN